MFFFLNANTVFISTIECRLDSLTSPSIFAGEIPSLPSGERTVRYGRSQFLMGKSTIKGHTMGHFPWAKSIYMR